MVAKMFQKWNTKKVANTCSKPPGALSMCPILSMAQNTLPNIAYHDAYCIMDYQTKSSKCRSVSRPMICEKNLLKMHEALGLHVIHDLSWEAMPVMTCSVPHCFDLHFKQELCLIAYIQHTFSKLNPIRGNQCDMSMWVCLVTLIILDFSLSI